ncbi:MAG: ferritin-like domain-containing protein [Polyangiaceae bacterium]
MSARPLRLAENRTRRLLFRVRALVAAASACTTAVVAVGACSTSSIDAAVDPYADGGSCARRPIIEDSGDDADAGCEIFFVRPCGFPPGTGITYPNCQFNFNDCETLCGSTYFNCFAFGDSCQPDGGIVNDDRLVVQCGACLGTAGRRPNGLVSRMTQEMGTSAIGKYFASTAYLEAASILAFQNLRRELRHFGAPEYLIAGAARAERDEVKHARLTARIAKRNGATITRARVRSGRRRRSLEEVAIENVVEGCVRETFAALLALEQADRATHSELAAVLEEIAIDETRHAALAWSVAAWADAQLDAGARARIETAKKKAISDLEEELAAEPDADLVRMIGLPNATEQKRLLHQLMYELSVDGETR